MSTAPAPALDFDAMTAGPEMDAMVAERVTGEDLAERPEHEWKESIDLVTSVELIPA